jgi:predicted nucleic acid-binding Zn ribbon protein
MAEHDASTWFAECLRCGQHCGVSIVEPNLSDRYYVACPQCGATGKDRTVVWVCHRSSDDRPGPGEAS